MQKPYSGYGELIGYELVEKGTGFARVRLQVGPQHLNRMEVPHGGVLATLLDTAAGFAVAFADGPDRVLKAVTLSMNIQFIGQAGAGEALIAEGRRVGGGRTVAFATAEISNPSGTVIARGDAVFRFLEKR